MELPPCKLNDDELRVIARDMLADLATPGTAAGRTSVTGAIVLLLRHAEAMADEVERVAEQRDTYRDMTLAGDMASRARRGDQAVAILADIAHVAARQINPATAVTAIRHTLEHWNALGGRSNGSNASSSPPSR
jgi:hypothetical protein